MKLFVTILLLVITVPSHAQSGQPYVIFTGSGKEVSYEKMINELRKSEVVFFGELHNNSITHWLELQVLKDLYAGNNDLALAMEMFEADDQIVLDEYLSGLIQEKHLLSEAKVWDNYKTDYKPLVEFAREKGLPVVASNVPRRYASMVYRKGLASLDSLPQQAKDWIAPLPLTVDLALPGYASLLHGMDEHSTGDTKNLAYSQALKDATMAHFLGKYKTPSNTILHINGAYHSQNDEGIVWYFKKLKPAVSVASIQVVEQSSLKELDDENKRKGDFVICVPGDMTRTH